MKKYTIILLIIFFGCKNNNQETEITIGLDKIAKNDILIEDSIVKPIINSNEFYKRTIELLKELGYNKESDFKKSRYQFKQFEQNNKLDFIGIRLMKNELWVDVVLYKYNTEEDAIDVSKKIVNDRYLEIIFKEYSNLYQKDNYLLLIKSGCNNVPKNWKEIKSSMNDVKINLIISCNCGGQCF
jgi:hypothetical protein